MKSPVFILLTVAAVAQGQAQTCAVTNDLFPAELFAPLPAPVTPQSDLAIVFWFDSRDPVGTLRHQVYDRRKGEFTPDVLDWLALVRRQYPDFLTSVRYLNVGRRDVADVVRETVDATRQELDDEIARIRRAHQSRRLGEQYQSHPGSGTRGRAGMRPAQVPHRIGGFGAPGASGIAPAAPSTYLFPTPYPYPRPHP